MNKGIILALAVVLGAASAVFPAGDFEGRYDMNFTGADLDVLTTFWVKGGHMKMRHHGQMEKMGEIIIRDDMSTMIVAMPQQLAYLEMPIPTEGDFSIPAPSANGELPFMKTDLTKEILGYKVQLFILQSGGEKTEIWATDELGSMLFARNQIFKNWAGAMRQVTGRPNFFPMETIGYSNGREKFRMKVTRIEKMKLPDTTFQPPAGYRKMELPAGMGGFMKKQ